MQKKDGEREREKRRALRRRTEGGQGKSIF